MNDQNEVVSETKASKKSYISSNNLISLSIVIKDFNKNTSKNNGCLGCYCHPYGRNLLF